MSYPNDCFDDEIIVVASALVICLHILIKYKTKNRSIWVNSYLSKRKQKGRFVNDFEDMRNHENTFRENFHMSTDQFDYILKRTEHLLSAKKETRPNDNISAKEKLAIGLEYLASGTMYRHIASTYRISKQAFGRIIDDVCGAMCEALKDEMPPLSQEDLIRKANEFHSKWNFPNCVGTLDGKHIRIKCPKNARSLFFNYKGFHSIVLMAIVDANYRFLYVDVGGYGSEGDASYFGNSMVGRSIIEDTMRFPDDTTFGNTKIPYFFLGDSGFPLCKRIITPYSYRGRQPSDDEKIFNYRLSRARRVVENAFGILSSKWMCLSRSMFCNPDRAQKIVAACCLLHNFLLIPTPSDYCPTSLADHYDCNGKLVEGLWRKKDINIFHSFPNNCRMGTDKGKVTRNLLKNYVNSSRGKLSWQNKSVFIQ